MLWLRTGVGTAAGRTKIPESEACVCRGDSMSVSSPELADSGESGNFVPVGEVSDDSEPWDCDRRREGEV